jgi:hypothetical protein
VSYIHTTFPILGIHFNTGNGGRHIPENGLLDVSMDMDEETGIIHNTP